MASNSSHFGKLALILGASAASAAMLYKRFQANSFKANTTDDEPKAKPEGNEEKVNALVEQRFQACSEHMSKRIPTFTQAIQLEFYAWYKQATQGDLDDSKTKAPPAYDLVKKTKYEAWKKLTGMSKSSAMQLYIDKAMLVEFTASMQDSADEDDDEDEFEDAIMDIGGLGMKPSTLILGDDEENDDLGIDMFPLHKASHYGHIEELKKILEAADTDPNAVDSSGQTALHLCADRGHVDCMTVLIKAGANLNAGDNDGITPLQAAVISGHRPACLSLLEAGADPDQEDRDGDTPRACAEDDKDIKELFGDFPEESSKSNGEYLKDLDQIQVDLDEGDFDM
jgi:acyl-CoA-binding protein